MQAESGQLLTQILARKELERQSTGGIFFWGVGNAPSRAVAALSCTRQEVDVVFSIMKSKPKIEDLAPKNIYVWRQFIDTSGIHDLPPGVLITSRGSTSLISKRQHFALICQSKNPLVLGELGLFNPSSYRNFSKANRPIGASQVTAIVKKIETIDAASGADYQINLTAKLFGSYWVKLSDPIELSPFERNYFENTVSDCSKFRINEWREFVNEVRGATLAPESHQFSLF